MKIYEQDYKKCQYCECSYYEHDTGYEEYECELVSGECCYGDIRFGCPLSFKYEIEE
jgi:hypothetical protein